MSVLPRGSGPADAEAPASTQRQSTGQSTGQSAGQASGQARAQTKTSEANAAPRPNNAAANAAAGGGGMLRQRLAGRIAALADRTTSQTKQATKQGLARAAEYGRGSVLPEIERTGAKLKEHARPARLKQDYRELQFWLHKRVLDPPREQLFFTPTQDPVALDGLTINSHNRQHGHTYRPTPCALFDWVIAGIDYDLSELNFVDYGAGKGRAMLLASEHPFAAVAGVEFAAELHDNAQMNIAQYPRSRMRCRNVECVLDDASQVGSPDGEAVHYFFNPFSRDVFAAVLGNIVMSYRAKPRRMYLVLIDPIAIDLVDASGVFARAELPVHERLKVQLLSPYDVAIFRSLA